MRSKSFRFLYNPERRARTAKVAILFSALLGLTAAASEAKPAETKQPASSASTASANWYPSSIALPSGLSYPCALTALPPTMDGIPVKDRVYINHVYAMILKCVQAKTIMLSKLTKGSARSAYSTYYASTLAALKLIRAEPTPSGLESFRNEIMQSIMLQMKFFEKASTAAEAGTDFNTILQIPEGRQASTQLQGAWGQMKARYSSLSPKTEDSMYHHLCALDLF